MTASVKSWAYRLTDESLIDETSPRGRLNQLNILVMYNKKQWRVIRKEINFDIFGLYINDVLVRTRKVRTFGF